MWMTADGRAITRSIPSDRFPILVDAVLALSQSQRAELEQFLDEREDAIADSLERLTFDSNVEAKYEALALPEDLIDQIDWLEMTRPSSPAIDSVDLRWRLDVLSAVRQALADVET